MNKDRLIQWLIWLVAAAISGSTLWLGYSAQVMAPPGIIETAA